LTAHIAALLVLLYPLSVHSESLPIQIDGDFSDWTSGASIGGDPAGDEGSSGIDFRTIYAADDQDWAFLRFDTTTEIQGDEGNSVVFALDTDENPGTGFPVGSLGAELVWRLGERRGFVYPSGSPVEIGHASIGLVLGPTVSGEDFELALSRSAEPEGMTLFQGPGFDVFIWDDDNGDAAGPYSYSFAGGEQPVPSISLTRDDPDHIRICAYNVQNDGLFSGGAREAALDRILNAVDPDVWVFCEVWDHNAGEVADRVEEFLPSGPGESWSAVKLDAGNVVVSRLDILDAWEIFPGNRLTAVLVDARPLYDSDLLVVANHWSCCTADQNRQAQADALIAFLRDARTPGGTLDLEPETPIVAAGDFNLVGWRRQLETLVTGDIADNGTWGPDSPPDWDGSDFDIATARHPDARFVYTWRRDNSTFYPGRLDYFCYSGSVVTLHNNFTVETRNMSPESLGDAGLLWDDTEVASDHGPVVGDLSLNDSVDVVDNDVPGGAWPSPVRNVWPNPLRETMTLSFEAPSGGPAYLSIFDSRGRLVRRLARQVGGHHEVDEILWDGRDAAGRRVTPGTYWYRLVTKNGEGTGRLVVLR
jgi:endonuclease/exonuclease/phosphatase family metal-dependent hydrolase